MTLTLLMGAMLHDPRRSSQRPLCRAALMGLSLVLSGCELSLTPAVGPTLDTRGSVGVEARLEGTIAVGAQHVRGYVSVAGGGGIAEGADDASGACCTGGFVSPEVGVEVGRYPSNVDASPLVRGSVGLVHATRVSSEGGARRGFGGTGQLLFRVTTVQPSDAALLVGPRLQGEYVMPEGATPEVGFFSLMLAARWIGFDTRNWF